MTKLLSFAFLLFIVPLGARADCALGASYQATVSTPNTVTVCLLGAAPACGNTAQAMLRQDVATGAIVKLATFCSAPNASPPFCFIDECVPQGSYRYGLADPFTCEDKGCDSSVPYFTTAQVDSAPSSTCTRNASDPGPTATTVAAPWGASATELRSCTGCSSSAVNTHVALLDLGAIAIGLAWLRSRKRT